MKNPLGCLSGYGLIASTLVSIGIVVATLLNGGVLFSPGSVTAVSRGSGPLQGFTSHADLEHECTYCHRPWGGADAARCLLCHTDVDGQISMRTGLHGRLQEAAGCLLCHVEHKGRDAYITEVGPSNLEHRQVGFALAFHRQLADGTPFGCANCHAIPGYTFEDTTCALCHREMDAGFMARHVAAYSERCLACHDGSGRMAGFEHGAVFPLDGAHAASTCQACHASDLFQGLPSDCVACHAEPRLHRGQFATDCAACHTAQGWRPARLHYHAFPLDHGNAGEVACQVCHPTHYVTYTCYGCHEHEQTQVERAHREEGIADVADCTSCHPSGREHAEGGD